MGANREGCMEEEPGRRGTQAPAVGALGEASQASWCQGAFGEVEEGEGSTKPGLRGVCEELRLEGGITVTFLFPDPT